MADTTGTDLYWDDREEPRCWDQDCTACAAGAKHRECRECGVEGWIIDCPQMDQPRPISSDLCHECAAEAAEPLTDPIKDATAKVKAMTAELRAPRPLPGPN